MRLAMIDPAMFLDGLELPRDVTTFPALESVRLGQCELWDVVDGGWGILESNQVVLVSYDARVVSHGHCKLLWLLHWHGSVSLPQVSEDLLRYYRPPTFFANGYPVPLQKYGRLDRIHDNDLHIKHDRSTR